MGKIKVKRGKERLMNFGPHRNRTYGEVLREEPEYVNALIKGNRRDNQKSRFAHWVMAYIVETFFQEKKKDKARRIQRRRSQREREEVGRAIGRRRTSAEREREKREEGEPDTDSEGVPKSREDWAEELGDILIDQFLKGNWSAVDRMTAQVREEQDNFDELMGKMEELLSKPKEGRTEAEFWQDKEAIEVLKRQFREQERNK